MPGTDHSDVGFVPSGGADHSDVGFVASGGGPIGPGSDFSGARSDIAKTLTDPRTYTKLLPMVGGAVGGAFGAPAGPAGMAVGTGMGAAAGKGLQHVADTALGYEKPISNGADLGGRLKDVGEEGAINAAVTGGLSAVPVVAKAIAPKLYDAGINAGRRFLTYGTGTLGRTEPLAADAVKEAYDQGAVKPLMSVQGASGVLNRVRTAVGDQYGKILVALKQAGIVGPEAEALADRMAMEGRSVAAGNTNPAVRSVYDKEASALRATETPGGTDFTVPRDANGNLAVDQTESLKRGVNEQARFGTYNETPQNIARKDVGRIYKEANEQAIDQGVQASNNPVTQAIGAQFQPVKQTFGRVADAADVAEQGAASAARRRVVSPSDMIAMASGVASGQPLTGMSLGTLNHLARTRGTSALAWSAIGTSQKLAQIATLNPAALGRYGPILAKAASEGPLSFAAHTYAISQTDPTAQQIFRDSDEAK